VQDRRARGVLKGCSEDQRGVAIGPLQEWAVSRDISGGEENGCGMTSSWNTNDSKGKGGAFQDYEALRSEGGAHLYFMEVGIGDVGGGGIRALRVEKMLPVVRLKETRVDKEPGGVGGRTGFAQIRERPW